MLTRAKTGIFKPKLFTTFVSDDLLEPFNYKQAMAHPHWFRAMKSKYDALLNNYTWTLTALPSDANLVGCKWVFKRKFNAEGFLQRYKARLVAKGFHQREGQDFSDTFSPVIKQATIRIVLAIALSSYWSIHQIDTNNAFIHGELDAHVYMQQPLGFSSPDSSQVCCLHEVIYGLKQAPRSWFHKLSTTLLQMGFLS